MRQGILEAGIGQCGHLNIGGGGGCEEGSGAACVEVWSKQHRKDAQDVWLKNSLGRARCLECEALGSIPSTTYTQTQKFSV